MTFKLLRLIHQSSIIWPQSTSIIQVHFLLLPRNILHPRQSGLVAVCATPCPFFVHSVHCSCNCLPQAPFVPRSDSSSGGSCLLHVDLHLTLGWTLRARPFNHSHKVMLHSSATISCVLILTPQLFWKLCEGRQRWSQSSRLLPLGFYPVLGRG